MNGHLTGVPDALVLAGLGLVAATVAVYGVTLMPRRWLLTGAGAGVSLMSAGSAVGGAWAMTVLLALAVAVIPAGLLAEAHQCRRRKPGGAP